MKPAGVERHILKPIRRKENLITASTDSHRDTRIENDKNKIDDLSNEMKNPTILIPP